MPVATDVVHSGIVEENGKCIDSKKRPRTEEAPRSALPAAIAQRLCNYIDSLQDRTEPVVRLATPEEIQSKFQDMGVPLSLLGDQAGTSPDDLEKAVDLLLAYSVRTGHPLFFNQLYARASPTAIAADWVQAATNTNSFTYEVAPVYILMENEVLAKVAQTMGGDYAASHDGLFVPGGSISNLYAMHLAHSKADPNYLTRGAAGGPRCVAFTSDQSHYSYLKSARLTGLGSDNLISVATDGQGRMLPDALEAAVKKAKEQGALPFFVGSTAGTTVLGAFDPYPAINDICNRYGMWHHIDGCWGGGAMLSKKHRHLMLGAEKADSLAWNPHKMCGSTLQTSIFITKHPGILAATNGTKAKYLFQPDKLNTNLDTGDKTIQCGRKPDVFKLWLLWKSIGDEGMSATVDQCFHLASFLASKIREDSSGAWQLVYEPSCSNVCFWYIPERLRPFKWETATEEQKAELNKVAPLMKQKMQKTGDALIGFQAINGRPNFFRMVFASADAVTEDDVTALMHRMAKIGEEEFAKSCPAAAL